VVKLPSAAPTRRLHREDPYRLEFEARVIGRREHEGRPAVVLDETAFYAESGGQPSDTGTLDGVSVVAVLQIGDEVLHVLSAPLPAERVRGRVDGERRRDHRQQHHGQHLLSRAFALLHGARTLSFHLGSEVCTIDLDRPVEDAQVAEAERRANEVVWEARPVRVRVVSRGEAEALGVEIPEGAGDEVRLVEAEGFDRQPCGGTHPRSTAEVGCVMVVGHERYKGGTRVRFVCGHRALRSFREQVGLLDRVAAQLSSAKAALPEVVERLLEQAAQARREQASLLERALRLEAARLYGEAAASGASPPLVVARFDDRSPDELQGLAQALVAQGPCLVLLGAARDKAHLVFAQSPGLGRDLPGLLKTAVALLGGRGGGKGDLARGGGDRVDRLDEALASAAAALRQRP
jgi:alanyl-tRNA synthetase